MSLIALGIGTAAAKIGGGIFASKKSKKENKKIEEQTAVRTKEEKAAVDAATKDQQRAIRDQANIAKGATSFSPEAKYAQDLNERAASQAIHQSIKGGRSSNEIMGNVAKITSQQQNVGERIGAAESGRRRGAEAQVGALGVQEANVGKQGELEKIGISDKTRSQSLQEQALSNQAIAQNYNYFAGALGDLTGAFMYQDMYGGGFNEYGVPIGGGLKRKKKPAGTTS
jgi:hypothetical protein